MIVMMEVMKINVIVVCKRKRSLFFLLNNFISKNYFLVNVIVNQVNFIVVVQMLQYQMLYVFQDHFNVMVIMIVLIVRMKLVVVSEIHIYNYYIYFSILKLNQLLFRHHNVKFKLMLVKH